jgi:predicted nucleic acid-binding protein
MTPNATSIIIVDSSALVSLLNPSDSNHGRASKIAAALTSRASLLVPGEVVSETLNIVGKKLGHSVAVAMGWRILETDTFVVGFSSSEIISDALIQFAEQSSGVSFTDCLVMQWARFYDSRVIFGFDPVFAENGYRLPPVTRI